MSAQSTSNNPCRPGKCIAGAIGDKEITVKDWATENLRFQGKIELWNELTKRFAIPHIGFAQQFHHCHKCGCEIDILEAEGDRTVLDRLVHWANQRHPDLKELDAIVAAAKVRVGS